MEGFAGRSSASQKLRLLLLMLAAFVTTSVLQVQGQGTRVGFYSYTCPRAEFIVRSTVVAHFQSDPTIAPGLLRMHFHDCFVRGCDASILIDGDNTEKTAPPNLNLRGYEVIDDAKAQLEKACPGIVSCADILALAARDVVVLTCTSCLPNRAFLNTIRASGASWAVPTGRRDGMVSLASDTANLPGFTESIDAQKQKFADKGLSTLDLVTLVGAHTIGTSACQLFNYRLFNFSTSTANGADPVMDPSFVPQLQALCPLNGDGTRRIGLDTGSSDKFDASFFANLRNGRGILESDQMLWTDATTKPFVQRFLGTGRGSTWPGSNFNVEFGRSMVKMSNIDVKIGTDGQIRKLCSAIN